MVVKRDGHILVYGTEAEYERGNIEPAYDIHIRSYHSVSAISSKDYVGQPSLPQPITNLNNFTLWSTTIPFLPAFRVLKVAVMKGENLAVLEALHDATDSLCSIIA